MKKYKEKAEMTLKPELFKNMKIKNKK